MSILIKGMEMPKSGEMLCINIYPNGKVSIGLDLKCKWIATAVPVPPHGRLIDGEALRQDWLENGENEYVYDTNAFLDSLDNTPTIIPAEPPKDYAPAKPYDLLYEEGGPDA